MSTYLTSHDAHPKPGSTFAQGIVLRHATSSLLASRESRLALFQPVIVRRPVPVPIPTNPNEPVARSFARFVRAASSRKSKERPQKLHVLHGSTALARTALEMVSRIVRQASAQRETYSA